MMEDQIQTTKMIIKKTNFNLEYHTHFSCDTSTKRKHKGVTSCLFILTVYFCCTYFSTTTILVYVCYLLHLLPSCIEQHPGLTGADNFSVSKIKSQKQYFYFKKSNVAFLCFTVTVNKEFTFFYI